MASAIKSLPKMKDLTTENITENVLITNSQCEDPRLQYLMERLVSHLHDFALEVQLSAEEWMTGIQFLNQVGQKSTDLRNEMILFSDVLGLSILVDAINHPKPAEVTEGTVEGPFHTHDAPGTENGATIHTDPDATRLFMLSKVKDANGNPLSGATVDLWEGDSKGFYDVQNPDRDGPDGRAVLQTNDEGNFFLNIIVPVPYPIPFDGPVGQLLKHLNRHPNRPAHIHVMVQKEGYEPLVTALYPRGDPYESSDPVFGVKESLVVDIQDVTEPEMAEKYNVPLGTKLLIYDFILPTIEEAKKVKEQKAMEAIEKSGQKLKLWNGLPVPDVD